MSVIKTQSIDFKMQLDYCYSSVAVNFMAIVACSEQGITVTEVDIQQKPLNRQTMKAAVIYCVLLPQHSIINP